jgi:hypothetical protein
MVVANPTCYLRPSFQRYHVQIRASQKQTSKCFQRREHLGHFSNIFTITGLHLLQVLSNVKSK